MAMLPAALGLEPTAKGFEPSPAISPKLSRGSKGVKYDVPSPRTTARVLHIVCFAGNKRGQWNFAGEARLWE